MLCFSLGVIDVNLQRHRMLELNIAHSTYQRHTLFPYGCFYNISIDSNVIHKLEERQNKNLP